jgi:hypothetical protein
VAHTLSFIIYKGGQLPLLLCEDSIFARDGSFREIGDAAADEST